MWRLSEKAVYYRAQEQERINARLKVRNADPITEYELDLRCFRRLPFGDKIKHEFLIRCWNRQWPDFFIIERDGYVNTWHVRMAKAFCKYLCVNMVGCASSGKTFVSAAYSQVRWKSAPFDTSVYLSTTSAEAGEARTWGTVKDLHNRDKFQIGKIINSLRVITLDEETRNEEGEKERDYRNCIKAVLIKTGSEGKNVVGSICGRKNKNVLWVCDEMAFMDIGILDARVNLYSNATDGNFSQFVGVGNAPSEGDPLYIDAEPYGPNFPDGWRSVDKDVNEWWTTRTGICLYFNGDKSPNMQAPEGHRAPFPRIMDREARSAILRIAGGEDTPIYWRQLYGFPPTTDVPDKIITHKLLESNGATTVPLWEQPVVKILAGLDLGFREGGDPCVLDFARLGKNTAGRTVLQFEKDGVVLNPSQSSRDAFEKQIAARVIDECRKRTCHDIALDVSGDGGMILQAIERQAREETYVLNVTPVSFSGAAEDRVVIPGETRKGREMFDRMVSQLWATFRISVQNKVIYGCDPLSKAVSQLCSRKFTTDDRKRFSVEKKVEMRKRIKRSPDHADARVICHHLALKHGLSGMESVKSAPKVREAQETPSPRQQYGHGHTTRKLYG